LTVIGATAGIWTRVKGLEEPQNSYDIGKSNINHLLDEFKEYLQVDRGLAKKTVSQHFNVMNRFFNSFNVKPNELNKKHIRSYLSKYLDHSSSSRRNQIKSLRVFFRDFLEKPDIVSGFKLPPVPFKPPVIPSKTDLIEVYSSLPTLQNQTMFLLYASSGLRRNELTSLTIDDIDLDNRMLLPKKTSRTKRSWFTFYNEEAESILMKYLDTDDGKRVRLFKVTNPKWMRNKLSPKFLRSWFCSEMGRLGVPDRYVDAFCGRTPKSVLARHYTDYSSYKLKEIYDKAGLRVLS